MPLYILFLLCFKLVFASLYLSSDRWQKKSLEKIYLIASENVRFIIFDFLLPSLRHKVQILFTPENVKNACKSLSRVFVQCLDENASQETSETRLQQRLSFSNVDINHFSLHTPQRGTVGTEFIPQ